MYTRYIIKNIEAEQLASFLGKIDKLGCLDGDSFAAWVREAERSLPGGCGESVEMRVSCQKTIGVCYAVAPAPEGLV